MIIFVNGKIGGGSPQAGKPYWTEPETPFVEQAKEYLNDSLTWFPETDFAALSHCKERESMGYQYCKKHLNDITIKVGDTINFIAHSMGCSFAEGMAKYLIESGYKLSTMIHINAFQAGEMTANNNIPLTIDFQYTDDFIIHIPSISCAGNIKGAIKVREKSHTCLRRRHRGPVYPNSTAFWKSIVSYLQPYNSSNIPLN